MLLKKSTQWDLVGVFALLLGFSMLMAFIYSGMAYSAGKRVDIFIEVYGNPFVAVFATAFSFMSFIFGHLEGKKEEQRQFLRTP